MGGTTFDIDGLGVLIAAIFLALAYFLSIWNQKFPLPKIYFSNLKALRIKKGWRERYAKSPKYLEITVLALFLLALTDPAFMVPRSREFSTSPIMNQQPLPSEGIAIYFVLDQSGSMQGVVEGQRPPQTKMDLLKQVTKDFASGRSSDLIGIVGFARGARVLSPLTLDHGAVIEQLETMDVRKEQDQDGTAIGYALYKTVNLISATRHYANELVEKGRPAYTIKNSVVVLVTDGIQDPNPLDAGKQYRNLEILDAGEYAKENDVRLYIINVEPRIAGQEYEAHRKIMKQVAEMTGGKFFMVQTGKGLGDIYKDIDQLEKSVIPEELAAKIPRSHLPHLFRRISLAPYLIAMGIFLFGISVLLRTLFFRRVP